MSEFVRYIFIVLMLSSSLASAKDLVITNARLIDGTGAAPVEAATIVVSHGRVVAVTQDKVKTSGAHVIDAKGNTVMPGLADLHVHSSIQFLDDPEFLPPDPRATHPDIESGIRSDKEMQAFIDTNFPRRMMKFLEAGVTTIVDPGSFYPWILQMRSKVRSGDVPGPRMYITGRTFTAPGGHPASTVCQSDPWCVENLTVATDDPQEARKAVRMMVNEGVDGLKLIYDVNLGGYSQKPIPHLKQPVMEAIIDEGHKLGVKVLAHTFTVDDAIHVVNFGVDGLVHGIFVERSGSQKPDAERLGTVLNRYDIPVTTTTRIAPTELEINHMPEEVRPLIRTLFEPYGETLKKIANAGVVLQFGTDFGGIGTDPEPRELMLREMRNLIAGGFSEMEVIKMLTSNTAKHPLTPEDTGVIKAGNVADIIILSNDPLKNISAVAFPQVVILAGKVVVDKR